MISRDQATKTALYELEQQREQNYADERRHVETVRAACPEIASLIDERTKLFSNGVSHAFGDPSNAMDISEKLVADMDRSNRLIRLALHKNGYPEDYLQPVFRCPSCHDTGYVGDLVHEFCPCVRQRVLKIMMSDEGLQDLETQNFSTFDETIFPDHPIPGKKHSQRDLMLLVRNRLEQYADSFEARSGKGIILSGASGLGKTFLMNCVAERVLTRGFSVLKISAYRLYDAVRKYQYDHSDAELVDDLIRADLLAIDDLGTEPLTRLSNEQSGLYYILNERINSNASMIITSNLNNMQTRERYGDRIGLRLYDGSRTSAFELYGEDVRRNVRK